MALLRVAHGLWALHRLWAVAVLLLLFGCTGTLSNKVRPDPVPATGVPEGPGVNGPIKDSTTSPGTGVSPPSNPNPDPGATSPDEPLPPDESYVPAATDLGFTPGPCSGTAPRISSTTETNADYSKGMINAQVAYDLGLTGHCTHVVVIDSGLSNPPHRELNSERITRDTDTAPATAYHGIATTSLVAAIAGNGGMHGVAPGANVYHRTIALGGTGYSGPSPADDDPYIPTSVSSLSGNNGSLASLFRGVLDKGSIFNMSWGLSGSISLPMYTTQMLRSTLPSWIALMQQADTHPDDRAIFVWAAGNAFNDLDASGHPAVADSPEILPGLPARIPELKGHWLAVAAVREDGLITDFSNRCGIAYDFCLAAPGERLAVPHQVVGLSGALEDIYVYRKGTSYAAPIVTGALALMMERFRGQLGNTDLVSRLLATANKTGIYADQDTYGQGLLDIGAAVQPVGPSYLSLAANRMSLNGLTAGFGDDFGLLGALSGALANTEILVRDSLGAPFWHRFQTLPGAVPVRLQQGMDIPLSRHLSYRGDWKHVQIDNTSGAQMPGYLIDSRFRAGQKRRTAAFATAGMRPDWFLGAYNSGLWPGDFGNDAPFSAPWMRLVADRSIGGGISLHTEAGDFTAGLFRGGSLSLSGSLNGGDIDNRLAMLEYARTLGPVRLIAHTGWLSEPGSWQGLHTDGSLYGGFRASTGYWGATGLLPLDGNWILLGSLHHSLTEAEPLAAQTRGLLTELHDLTDTRLQLGAVGRSLWRRGDSLGVRLGLARQGGRADWHLPVRLHRGEQIYADLHTEASPGVRGNWQLHYRLPLGGGTHLGWQFSDSIGVGDEVDTSAQAQTAFSLRHRF